MKLKSFHEGRYIVTGFTSTSDNPWPILQSHYNCKLQLLSSNRDNFIVITTLVSKYTNVAPFIMVATGSRFLLACSGQFHPSTSYRGRLTKFHPSTSSGSFGRLCACKQKISKPVRSTLLDEFGNKVYSIYWSLLAIEILFAFFIQQIKPLHKIRYIWWYSN